MSASKKKRTRPVTEPVDLDTLGDSSYLRLNQLLTVIPMSGVSIWRCVRTGKFPPPVKLSDRITAWRVGDIREWLAERETA